MAQKLDSRGEVIPSPARHVAGEGCRRAPAASARKAGPPQRPVNPAHLLRYVQIQFHHRSLAESWSKVEGLRLRLWHRVRGAGAFEGNVSLSEDSVRRIWDRPFTPEFRKHSKAIATRTGPFHTLRPEPHSGYGSSRTPLGE